MKKLITIVVIAVMLQLAVVSMASAAPPADGPQGYHHTNCGYGYYSQYCNNYNRYRPVYKYRYTTYRYYYHPPVYNNCYNYRCYPTYNRVYYTPRCYNCNYAYYW
ncbi:MAG: hypothetical protein Kow0031_24410 [Anaerolineae bacterium]